MTHKMAHNIFIHHLVTIPMDKEDFKYIAVANGYKSDVIDKFIKKCKINGPFDVKQHQNQAIQAVHFDKSALSICHKQKNYIIKKTLNFLAESNRIKKHLNTRKCDVNTSKADQTGV